MATGRPKAPGEDTLPRPEIPGVRLVGPIDGLEPRDLGLMHFGVRRSDRREVAVKVFRPALTLDRDRERFWHEAEALVRLGDHPHIVQLQDAGVTTDGYAYLVMEYCPDGSLADRVATLGRLTPAEARAVGWKVADALAYAHSQGIVHGSVKPSNILANGRGEPALTDFRLTALGTLNGDYSLGSPSDPLYSAPEAFLPELAAPATDVYSLGATLYALLAGRPPRVPTGVAAERELMAVLDKAMALDPRDRYGSAAALRDAFR